MNNDNFLNPPMIPRRTFTWALPRTSIELGSRTVVMGILNLTPDSFSDGGQFNDPARALERALQIEAEGADILDIGGESTRPQSEPVGEEEEIQRVMPLLDRIASQVRIPISIDTYRSALAERAMAAGAQIINDISAFRIDPAMSEVARRTRAGVVLMHSRGPRPDIHTRPPYEEAEAIREDLARTAQAALAAGLTPEAIVLDPGIGFSKSPATSLKILQRLDLFSTLGHPLLVGVSRKSFIRVGIDIADVADWATAAAVTLAIAGGAHIVRVHDVARMRVVAKIADSIEKA